MMRRFGRPTLGDRIRDNKGFIACVVVFAVLVVICIYIFIQMSSGGDPTKNDHARICVEAHGTIHEKKQYGGKFYTYTWWCTDRDDRVTDIWFSADI